MEFRRKADSISSRQLIKEARGRGWQVICDLKSNRQLNGTSLKMHAQALKHWWYIQVAVITADGTSQTYYVRQVQGRLTQPAEIHVFLSERHPQGHSLAYIACTDLACSAKVANSRARSVAAVDRYMVVMHLVWAYVEQCLARERPT